MTAKRVSIWARLKGAGARANGLSAADAVHERIGGPEDGDYGKDGADAGKDAPDDRGANQAECAGNCDDGGDKLFDRGREDEFEQRQVKGLGAGEEWWQLWNCSGSLAATSFAVLVLVVSELLNPAGPGLGRPSLAVAVYGFWFTITFAGVCVMCRLGEGSFGLAVSGEFRFGAGVVAIALLWSEIPLAMSLAGWIAVAAFALGGAGDGGWLAVVSLRREVPPWRALRIVLREEKQARREFWRRLYWEGGR